MTWKVTENQYPSTVGYPSDSCSFRLTMK